MNGWLAILRSWLPGMPPNLLPPTKREPGAEDGASKARRRISSMPSCIGLIRCWPCLTTLGSLLPITRLSEIFAWQKCSKRLPVPFAALLGRRPFVASAAIFLPCRNRVIPCCPLWLLFSITDIPYFSHFICIFLFLTSSSFLWLFPFSGESLRYFSSGFPANSATRFSTGCYGSCFPSW